jgi:hypothetical protein
MSLSQLPKNQAAANYSTYVEDLALYMEEDDEELSDVSSRRSINLDEKDEPGTCKSKTASTVSGTESTDEEKRRMRPKEAPKKSFFSKS